LRERVPEARERGPEARERVPEARVRVGVRAYVINWRSFMLEPAKFVTGHPKRGAPILASIARLELRDSLSIGLLKKLV